MKKIIISTTTLLLFFLLSFFAFKAYDNSKSYQEMTEVIVQKQNISNLTTTKIKKFVDSLSLGFYNGYDEITKENKKNRAVQEYFKNSAIDYTIYFMITLFILLLLYFVTSLRYFTITISIGGLISLVAGLFIPIMMITIHKNIEHIGDIVLTMEAKGVLGSIHKLFENGDFIVAGALLIFSIIFPILKTLSMLFVAIFINIPSVHNIVHFFKLIGKWSMADVFVVSIFLVYLSASKGDMSRAETMMGIYFFLAYVIISMLASFSADRLLQANKQA
ncbi:conserved protein of unknown function; putative membrane protein [hydrothermal vent metagenome]|uniref:Paraquat-inducible protein A n=1 Tax=hydrothermal vent metagenome TaxID=652676 RepID=A0A1W1BGC8_9ZZZZ